MGIRTFAAVVALVLSALAPSLSAAPAVLALDAVRTQQAEIRIGVESRTGIYKQLSESDRDLLLREQTQLLRIIDDKRTADDLELPQRIAVFNSLEQIEALVNKAEDERMVCEYTKKIGSQRKTRVCRTVAQLREHREMIRSQIDSHGVSSLVQRN